MPPMAGLQDIWPRVSMLWVKSNVLQPIRAAARQASVPAWPPPMTITSKTSGCCMAIFTGLRVAGHYTGVAINIKCFYRSAVAVVNSCSFNL